MAATLEDVAWDLEPLVDGEGEAGAARFLQEAQDRSAAFAERYQGKVASIDGAKLAEAVGLQQLLDARVVELRPFELEEDEPRLDHGRLLLDALQQGAVGGLRGVGREAQHRVGAGLADELGDLLELRDGVRELRAVDARDLALEALGKGC